MSEFTKEEADLADRAVALWGTPSQLGMLVEECAELIVAVSHCGRDQRDKQEALRELVGEVADVEFLIKQVIRVLGIEALVERARPAKLERFRGYVEREEVRRSPIFQALVQRVWGKMVEMPAGWFHVEVLSAGDVALAVTVIRDGERVDQFKVECDERIARHARALLDEALRKLDEGEGAAPGRRVDVSAIVGGLGA
jgi:NTP pyrophosphatase (non-canonical NTP hydrolase)